MRNIVLLVFLAFVLLTICEKTLGSEIYKWVDEKGIVHYSENPPSVSTKDREGQLAKEDSISILKKREFGNREIPKDMLKYGAAPDGSGGSQQNNKAGSVPVRRGRT